MIKPEVRYPHLLYLVEGLPANHLIATRQNQNIGCPSREPRQACLECLRPNVVL